MCSNIWGMRPAVWLRTHALIWSTAALDVKSTWRAPAPYWAASVRRNAVRTAWPIATKSASPIATSGGGGVAPGFHARGTGGVAVVTRSLVIALNASSRPFAGKPNTSSICDAVLPIAPTRAIANAQAMLSGDMTKFLPVGAPARISRCANVVMPAVNAPVGESGPGTARGTFAASTRGWPVDVRPAHATRGRPAATAKPPASNARRETFAEGKLVSRSGPYGIANSRLSAYG